MFPTSAIISRYFELSAFKNKEFYIYVHSLVDLDEKLTSRLHHTPSLCSLLGHVRPEDLQLGPGSRRSALRSDQQVLAPQRTYVWRPHGLRQEGHGMAMGRGTCWVYLVTFGWISWRLRRVWWLLCSTWRLASAVGYGLQVMFILVHGEWKCEWNVRNKICINLLHI